MPLSFWHNTGAWQTDRQTEGRTDRHVAITITRASVASIASRGYKSTSYVSYKLAVLAYRSLHGTAPQYLTSLTSASEVTGRQYLRSAAQQKLIVPPCRRKTFGCRAFSVASPSVWNALPDSLRDPELTLDIFRRHLKTYFFTLLDVSHVQRIRNFLVMRYINVRFTYLLTYYSLWYTVYVTPLFTDVRRYVDVEMSAANRDVLLGQAYS